MNILTRRYGHEVDLVMDQGSHLELVEIKSSTTFAPSFTDQIDRLNELQKRNTGTVVYGGKDSFDYKNIRIQSWTDLF